MNDPIEDRATGKFGHITGSARAHPQVKCSKRRPFSLPGILPVCHAGGALSDTVRRTLLAQNTAQQFIYPYAAFHIPSATD